MRKTTVLIATVFALFVFIGFAGGCRKHRNAGEDSGIAKAAEPEVQAKPKKPVDERTEFRKIVDDVESIKNIYDYSSAKALVEDLAGPDMMIGAAVNGAYSSTDGPKRKVLYYGSFIVEGESIRCQSWSERKHLRPAIAEFCDHRGLEIRKALRKKIKSLAKRPM